MLRKIEDLLEQHGELTFQQICHEMNCYTEKEVDECKSWCRDLGRLGECNINGGTVLYLNPVGCRETRRTELERY